MVRWHYRLDGYELEQALGVSDGQGSLVCCSPWGHKESNTTEWLNWTELKEHKSALRLKRCRQSYWNSALVTYSCTHYGGPKGSCLSKSSLFWGGSKGAPQDARVEVTPGKLPGGWLMFPLSLFFLLMFIPAPFRNAKIWKQRYPWVGEWIINLWQIQTRKFIQH